MKTFASLSLFVPWLLLAPLGCKSEQATPSDDLASADLSPPAVDLVAAAADLAVVADLTTALDPDLTPAPTPDLFGVPACDALVLQPSVNLSVASGDTVTMLVTVARGAATGALTVTASDPSGQIAAPAIVIAEGDSEGELTFTAVDTVVDTNGIVTLTITGACTSSDTVNYNVSGTGDYTLTIDPTSKSISRDTSDGVLVTIERIAGFGGRTVTFTTSTLPTGVTVAPLSLTGLDTEASLVFAVSPTATLGTFDVTIDANANLANSPAVRSATLTLTITGAPGFTLAAASTASVVQGEDTALALSVTREVGFSAALTTELLQAPAGVTATGGSFVTSGLDATLTIVAAEDARLLVPTAATIRTTDGAVSRTLPLEVIVAPAPDVQRDASFGTDGVRLHIENRDGGDYPRVVHRTNDDKFLVYASSGVRRLDASGAPDATFAPVAFPTVTWPTSMTKDATSGEVFGVVKWGANEIRVGKYTAAGAIDTAFGTDGASTVTVAGLNLEIAAIAAANGKVYVGLLGDTTTTNAMVACFDAADGSLDTSFGDEGLFVYDSGANEYVSALQPLADGGLAVLTQISTGSPGINNTILRLDDTGALLSSFGGGDGVLSVPGATAFLNRPLVRGDVLQLMGMGYDVLEGVYYHEIVRLSLTTGAIDTDFGTAGVQRLDGLSQEIFAIVDAGDGDQLVVCGRDLRTESFGMYIARLESDGTFDASFGAGGISRVRGGTESGLMQACTALLVDPSGDYWAFGQFQPNHFLAKYHP